MGCCNVVAILSMADMVCLDCMQKLSRGIYGLMGGTVTTKLLFRLEICSKSWWSSGG